MALESRMPDRSVASGASASRSTAARAASGARGAGHAARERILEGTMQAVIAHGASVSMADIASACGVSKALLHYHHADRAHLLAEVVEVLAARIVARERAAIGAAPPGTGVDATWRWISGELQRGELRALLELAMRREASVRAASTRAAQARRARGASTTAHLFSELGLTPRLPDALLGDASVAFIDGLALDAGSERDPRVSFDIFWLALLSLAE